MREQHARTKEHPCRKAAHEMHEEKEGCPYSEDICPFLRINRPLVFKWEEHVYGSKKIDNGKARVIIINEHALFELINETIMDHLCGFFDLHDSKKVTLETQWHRETNSLIAVVYNRSEKRSVELNELRDQIGATTSSMFSRKRYITIDLAEV